MERSHNEHILLRKLVITADFVILNMELMALFKLSSYLTLDFNGLTMKMTFFVANTALLISEYFYPTIIHIRRIRLLQVLKRTQCLAGLTTLIFTFSLKVLTSSGGLFYPCLCFGLIFYTVLAISRLMELQIVRYYRSKGYNIRTAVFVGNDPAIINMYNALLEDTSAGYKVLGYYADEKMPDIPNQFLHLGSLKKLNEFMEMSISSTIDGMPTGINDLYCSLSYDLMDEIISIMQYCDKNVIHFYYVPRMLNEYKLHLESLQVMGETVFTNRHYPLSNVRNRTIKRLFDIGMSSIVCICMLPFFPIIALLIKTQSPGPLFFRQKRTGLNGKTFECLKFRSMHVNKDADKIQATKDDSRKFAFGNFMRKTNIDEFPQFINVLKGDMSVVGPRPHMLLHTETYGILIDKYMVRHFSKPGITGWAQVTGFRGETKELWQMKERIKRDTWYIENWSLWLDIRIILMTAKSIVFPDKNAY